MFARIAARTGVQLPSPPLFRFNFQNRTQRFNSVSAKRSAGWVVAIFGRLSYRRKIMATYISLVRFTDKGIRAAKETTQRLTDWAAKVQSMGVTIKQMYWTLGQYDQVCVFEAPDDETAASVLLAADLLRNIRTQTMRAFTTSEMEKILA